MLLIGITGGIACGKTEVAEVFREKGTIILSGDEIGREVVEQEATVLRELVSTFGRDIVNKDGTLDRRKLGRIAFASEESRERLNKIVHPHLLKELRKKIQNAEEENPRAVVVVDAALIVEWGLEKELDHLIFVQSKKEDNIRRLQKQKGYSEKEALNRIESQLPEKVKEDKADMIIRNHRGLAELREAAEGAWRFVVDCLVD
jgi:dephospho-CoA kinase